MQNERYSTISPEVEETIRMSLSREYIRSVLSFPQAHIQSGISLAKVIFDQHEQTNLPFDYLFTLELSDEEIARHIQIANRAHAARHIFVEIDPEVSKKVWKTALANALEVTYTCFLRAMEECKEENTESQLTQFVRNRSNLIPNVTAIEQDLPDVYSKALHSIGQLHEMLNSPEFAALAKNARDALDRRSDQYVSPSASKALHAETIYQALKLRNRTLYDA